ncbi:hypothetical protein MKW94_018613 [Papaver nudicaule]|uniref:Uncharacterized protein n=1 Tax=Papaver nudicaule TaxID=74823 RepID=A0AA41W153_PAPNU|nr:hypothetical protein [Papaver nudicaule]
MPYPPCGGGCGGTKRVTWPQLVGKPGAEAKATIERDYPDVTAIIVPENYAVIGDFCCNRAWVFVKNDPQKTVALVPMIG